MAQKKIKKIFSLKGRDWRDWRDFCRKPLLYIVFFITLFITLLDFKA